MDEDGVHEGWLGLDVIIIQRGLEYLSDFVIDIKITMYHPNRI